MDKAGPSRSRRSRSRRSRTQITPDGDVRSVHSRDEDWDVPQAQKKLKGKAIQPEGSRRSAFQRLGHEGRNQNRPAKERLGVETTPLSAFDRLGRGAERPGQTRRTKPLHRKEPQHSRAPHEEEAESHPRHTFRSHVEQPRDRVGRVEARLEKLQRRVDRDEKKKILLNEFPFTDRVHETPFPKKAKLEVPKFTGKDDPEIHVKTLHQSGRMMGLSGDEKCLLFFQTLRGRAAYWFHNLPAAGQREHEDLTKFLTRWKDEVDKVEEMDDKTAMSLLVSGLRSGELYKEFCRRPPQSYQEAYNTAWDYADAEAQVSSKREAEQGHSKGKISLKKEIELPGRAKAEVMEGVIKQMIEAGEIDPEYLAQAKQKKNQWVRSERQPAEQNKKKKAAGKEHLQVIYGGPEGGDSASQRKKWGRELYVGTVALNPRSKQARREPITFIDRDLPATGEDHNDPLVITMDMGGVDVSRVLVDTGSSVNVLYLDAFEKLKLCRTRLEPLKTPLSGFTGDSVEAEGSILLICELGTGDHVVQKQMRFVVVNIKCVHNAILGRPGINKVRGVISMAHLCMKFYTPGGIGQVRGDQKKARSCYLEAVKKMTKAFERVTLVSQEEERSKLEPGDETEQIVLREAFPGRMVRIGRDLPGGLREEIISVLRECADIFAWSVADMPGIDRSVICHRLAVMEGTAIKGQALADFLVELTGLEPEAGPFHTVEPWWDMAIDGASGPKGCGAGVVFTTPEGFKIYHALVFNFKLTNNEAEYEALAGGLRLARALGIKRMKIRSESSLVVGQVNGEMEVKEDRLARYSDLVRALIRELEEFRLTRIPRSENGDADMLSKLTQACPEHVSKLAKIEILDVPSIDRFEVAAIQPGQTSATGIIGADADWRYELMEYLETGQKPDDEERARKVVLRAPRFQVIDGHLYKRAIGGLLLRCLTNPEAEWVIAEVHEGVCAAHQMSRTLAQRIILLGYYWPTIVGDCERYVQRSRLPVEAEIPTFRETVYQPGQNEVDHLAELNLVEEGRTIAAVKMAGYQQSVKRYHDNRVGPRYFQVHDEVLRRRDASKSNERGKLARNWEGPYRVKAIVRPGTYQLETMEGVRVDRHWNSHHLRKFYR
ncbi:unnamed protein product [Cuscuta campestris]|uniref:RNase H type-1 domain-containing protein n=1 Tax=Cuscuta campestris TaxID=132261 RepID=A0A484M412_9ASTE|nr:unnamed protein product [Cuscuta campestris]